MLTSAAPESIFADEYIVGKVRNNGDSIKSNTKLLARQAINCRDASRFMSENAYKT